MHAHDERPEQVFAPSVRRAALGDSWEVSAIQALQMSAGNAAVNALMNHKTEYKVQRGLLAGSGENQLLVDRNQDSASVQRQAKPTPLKTYGTGVSGQLIYGLSPARTAYIEEQIKAKDYDAAVKALVDFLDDDNEIDRSLLEGRTMYYDPTVQDDAATAPPGFNYSTLTYPPKSEPCRVRFGESAFKSGVAYLHSVMMHEYQHVLGYQEYPGGQSGVEKDAAEVTAYAWEIRNAEMTKLSAQPLKVAGVWEHLVEAFAKVTKNQARQLAPLAQQALQAAQKLVKGSGARLSPLPPI